MSRRKHTPLNKRKREGRSIRSPFHILEDKIDWSSWKDDYLPNVLWACGTTAALPRKEYLATFRNIAARARTKWKDKKHVDLTHAALSTVEFEDFEYVFDPLKKEESLRTLVASISLIDSLPDARHWRRFCGYIDPSKQSLDLLATGIARCLDHQSEQSTDIRWLKVVYLAICGRLVLPNEEMVDQLRLFPDFGDMRSVRPMIRAAEMSIRMMENGPEKAPETPSFPIDQFWRELFSKTACIPAEQSNTKIGGQRELLVELHSIAEEICSHFMNSITTTGVDPKLDGAFGIVVYSFHLCIELAALPTNQLSSGAHHTSNYN